MVAGGVVDALVRFLAGLFSLMVLERVTGFVDSFDFAVRGRFVDGWLGSIVGFCSG